MTQLAENSARDKRGSNQTLGDVLIQLLIPCSMCSLVALSTVSGPFPRIKLILFAHSNIFESACQSMG
jgi:hypothetical protein